MSTTAITKIRSRCWPYINDPATAAAANMTASQLQQFRLRAYNPSAQQLQALALYFNVSVASHG